MKYLSTRDFLWILPLSLALGAGMSFVQPGNWFIGWAAFSFLFLLSFALLTLSTRWAGSSRALAWMVALAFILRLAGGVATYLILPVNGYDEPDDRAGYVYTDAHRRDAQAWDLAQSKLPIYTAFSESYAYDQYGGLLGFSALVYRYLSPDAHRPLMLVLLSALIAALGVPFLWRAARQVWGDKVALVSGWIYALYPESILLGGSAMREPYLMGFSAFAFWGFADWNQNRGRHGWLWLGLGLAGMLLVSPVVALVTLVIFAGWLYVSSERGRIPWWAVGVAALIFLVGLFLLSSAVNRQGQFNTNSPFGILGGFLHDAVHWDMYQLERGSGWVQKLFHEMPAALQLPFVVIYGIFQPVLPASIFAPTKLIWQIIGLLRSIGWYALLPALIFSFVAAASQKSEKDRKLSYWLTIVVWFWILLTALRGGGDQWDNPRYRAILFLWEAILAGQAIVAWYETRNPWFWRIVAAEVVFLLIFTEWYASRYLRWNFQLSFGGMVALILGFWIAIGVGGWLWDRRRRA
ncbi:MAG TPA: glycosyltransferase family 39 protein [Anaerolineales bacterium]|nr:glycosyltransferase family 39 protein [Anaerolineales bacterium]